MIPRWPFLRPVLTLLLAAALVLGGVGFGTPAAAPMPSAPMADCPHHAGMAADCAMDDHGDAGRDHGGKQAGCHCPLMTCSAWTLAPVVFTVIALEPATATYLSDAAGTFLPHPPGVPLQPPRL